MLISVNAAVELLLSPCYGMLLLFVVASCCCSLLLSCIYAGSTWLFLEAQARTNTMRIISTTPPAIPAITCQDTSTSSLPVSEPELLPVLLPGISPSVNTT